MSTELDLGSQWVHGSVAGGILRVRIDRVERRNAMTLDMYRAVKHAAIHADRAETVRVMVLTGTADVFASGGDMAGNAAPDSGLDTEWDPTDHFPFRHLERCRKPVIAAVNGICQAGGLNLLMYCDFSIASDRAEFRAPELLRGIPDPWMLARLPGYVGVGTARRLIYTAVRFDATEASDMGLLGRVVPHEDLGDAVDAAAAAVMACAPGAMATAKAALTDALPQPDVAMFSKAIFSKTGLSETGMSAEMAEGMAAFAEKRDPDWLP